MLFKLPLAPTDEALAAELERTQPGVPVWGQPLTRLVTLGQSRSPPEVQGTFPGAVPSANGLRRRQPPSWWGSECCQTFVFSRLGQGEAALADAPAAFCSGPPPRDPTGGILGSSR